MDFNPFHLAAWYLVFVFSCTVHEAAHALAAWKLGDSTAYHGGQVSLDPTPHIKREPIGMVVIPLISFLINGWVMGWASAPYDPDWAWRHPKRSAWMAFAGPLSNFALMALAIALIRAGTIAGVFFPPDQITSSSAIGAEGAWQGAALLLSVLFTMNMIMFVFNLLPLPPMDGSCVIMLGLNDDAARRWMRLVGDPGFALIGLLAAWYGFRFIFQPIHLSIINLLYPGTTYS
ncbi:MAG: site-2 protease family protein [Candidatus Sumerlaeia bacterium]